MITVLMPVYNGAMYIKEAIDSVLAQSYADFELLIINDGSTDETASILITYSDPRIRVVHQENMKLIATLNKGLALAKGEWIARIDADDVCYPERLAEQMSFINENQGYILVASEVDNVDKDGNFLFSTKSKYRENEDIIASQFISCPFTHSAVFFLKEAAIKAGGYSEYAYTYEDHLLWRNIGKYGKMKILDRPLIKYRFNPASVTIDEKWRGQEFNDIKRRSIARGLVTAEECERLKKIVASQDFKEYKEASYYSMMAKKYLWNQYNPLKARENIKKAISILPNKREPYLLFLLSYFPEKIIKGIYKIFKK